MIKQDNDDIFKKNVSCRLPKDKVHLNSFERMPLHLIHI